MQRRLSIHDLIDPQPDTTRELIVPSGWQRVQARAAGFTGPNGRPSSTATLRLGDMSLEVSQYNDDDDKDRTGNRWFCLEASYCGPRTYLVDGEQYITLLVGWGGGAGQTMKHVTKLYPGAVYTFKLGGEDGAAFNAKRQMKNR